MINAVDKIGSNDNLDGIWVQKLLKFKGNGHHVSEVCAVQKLVVS